MREHKFFQTEILNKSSYPDRLIHSLWDWGLMKLGLPHYAVATVKFFDYDRGLFRGTAWRGERQIIVRINPSPNGSSYPLTHKYPGRRGAPEYVLRDQFDALACVVLHELAHFRDWQDGGQRTRDREVRVEHIMLPHLERFKERREVLFAEWDFKPPVIWTVFKKVFPNLVDTV